MFQTKLGKLFFATFSALTIVTVMVSYNDARDERDLLYLQKQQELLAIATQLDGRLDIPFEEILVNSKAQSLSEDEQTTVLNQYLQPKVMALAKAYPNVGLGIYSRRLDRNIAVGPAFDPAFLKQVTAPGALDVYDTGRFTTLSIQHSILWGGKPILAVHYPIYRNGTIIGHTFANAKSEDIEAAYQAGVIKRISWISGIWLLVITFVSYVFYKIRVGRKKLIEIIQKERGAAGTLSDFPEYIPILETVTELRKNIIERNRLINWVMTQGNAGVVVFDKDKKIIFVNGFAGQYAGLKDPQTLIGLSCEEWIDSVGAPEKEVLLQALNGLTIMDARIGIGTRIIRLNASPIQDPDTEKNVAVAFYFWDVTENEERNRKAKEISIRLAKLIELCPMPILELDKDGHILRLNPAMVQFYRNYLSYQHEEEIIGKSIQAISTELGIDFSQSLIAQVLAGQELRNKHVERLDRHWIVNGLPIYDPDTGMFAGALAFYHDITEYENFKNEMARLECLNAIGETASSVAHELRNPSTTVRGFIQILSAKCPKEYREYFNIILEELDRMNEIIEDFLSLARNRFVHKAPYNLNNVLHSLYPLLLADALKNGVELVYDLSEDLQMVEMNPKEIRQLALNLSRNGIEAMNAKGTLTISTKNVTDGVELVISDTGTGIPPEVLTHIFEPFYTSKKHGTGLGLSVSRNIVEGHNGTIRVQSEMGKGTVFTICLPV